MCWITYLPIVRYSHWAHLNGEDHLDGCVRSFYAFFVTVLFLMPACNGRGNSPPYWSSSPGSTCQRPLYMIWNERISKQQPNVQCATCRNSGRWRQRSFDRRGRLAPGRAPIPDKTKRAQPRFWSCYGADWNCPWFLTWPGLTARFVFQARVWQIFILEITHPRVTIRPALVRLNPNARLPAFAIQVFHRTAGKGSFTSSPITVEIEFPNFLSSVGRSDPQLLPVGTTPAIADMTEKVSNDSRRRSATRS